MYVLDEIKKYLNARYSEKEYPALQDQYERFIVLQPFKGAKLLDATPLFHNTLLKYMALIAGGAELTVGISGKIPYDSSCLDFLHNIDIRVIKDIESFEDFDVIMDCGAVFSHFKPNYGYVELTRSGYYGYINSHKPVFMTDSGRIKEIETSLGTGEGYFRAMEHFGYTDFKNRLMVVFGSGKVGKGIIIYAQQHGANVVTITDTTQILTVHCDKVDFRDIDVVKDMISKADYIVTATGKSGALTRFADSFLQSNAIIANMGVEDEFGSQLPEYRVLNRKQPLNFILDEPTKLRYIDATMALDNEGALYLIENKQLPADFIEPTAELEQYLIDVTRRHGLIADEIDRLLYT